MTKVHTTVLTSVALFTLVIGAALPVEAQEQLELSGATDVVYDLKAQTNTDCDDTDDRCDPAMRGTTTDKATPIREGGQTIDAGTIPERPGAGGGDTDSDGTERAQNNNSLDANQTDGIANPDFNDPDDDGDGLPTTRENGDQASPKLFDGLSNNQNEDETGDIDGDGRADAATRASGFIKFGDIKGEVRANADTGERRLSSIAIAARDLRNWTKEDREAFTRLREAVASRTPEAASIKITELVLADDQIEELEASENEARVRYRANIKLFGLIPMEREVQAWTKADGSVEIDYPWYRFLSSTPDTEAIKSTLKHAVEMLMTPTADSI